ncbi:hypothetical protein SLE2022_161490 [Rubroshorea leprosula]
MNMSSPVYGFPGFLSPFLSILGTSIQFPKRNYNSLIPFLPFTRLNFVSCAHYVIVSDEPTSVSAPVSTENSPVSHDNGFQKIPRISYSRKKSSFASSSKVTQRDGRSKPANLHKARLRRYSRMLHDCVAKGSIREGKTIHGRLITRGIVLDSRLSVSLIDVYAKRGRVVYARKVLDGMPERDVVSWTALIVGFVAEGCGSGGLSSFCEMREEGIRPNEFTLATILKACCMCFDFDFGRQIHAEAIKLGIFLDLFVGSALVDVYAKCGEMELAEKVFSFMPEKNVVLCNALLNGYSEMGHGEEVLKLFHRMSECQMNLSKFTMSTVLKGCSNSGYVKEGQVVHSMAIKIGCELSEVVSCALVDLYSKFGLVHAALKIFENIKDPDVVAWSAIITCLDQQGQSWEAAHLFNQMRDSGVTPNQFTLCSLVCVATHLSDLHYGESVHACICKYGFQSDNLVRSSLITMYMQNGCMQNGARVFEAMTHQDSVSWNAFLSGFNDYKNFEEVLGIFYKMLMEGVKPDVYTFTGVLRSCCGLLDVAFGKQVHAHTIKNSLDGNNFVGTALINMYVKSGYLEEADVTFNRLINRDVVAWTTIIAGYADTGQAEKTLSYFYQMQIEGVKPNEFTVASCLSSCSLMATLENGQLLHSMAIKAGFSSDMFVSSALVDMYGKCGCIEDAEAVFQS